MKKILVGLLAVVVLIVIVGLVMPTAYKIEQSVVVRATPAEIHVFAGDLKRWPEWTPWQEDDPSIVTTYGELTTGVGASQTWTSKDGDGELTVTESDPSLGIAYDMAFIMDGTRAPAKCVMKYEQSGADTTITWTMVGDTSDFMPPVLGGYMTPLLTKEIDAMFVRGLEKLAAKVEGR